VKLAYKYTVGRTTYKGTRLSFSKQTWKEADMAQRFAEMYKGGDEVIIRNHPAWPGLSVIDTHDKLT
jgi:hypothetical protein